MEKNVEFVNNKKIIRREVIVKQPKERRNNALSRSLHVTLGMK